MIGLCAALSPLGQAPKNPIVKLITNAQPDPDCRIKMLKRFPKCYKPKPEPSSRRDPKERRPCTVLTTATLFRESPYRRSLLIILNCGIILTRRGSLEKKSRKIGIAAAGLTGDAMPFFQTRQFNCSKAHKPGLIRNPQTFYSHMARSGVVDAEEHSKTRK